MRYYEDIIPVAEEPTMLTYNKSRLISQFGFVYRDDRLGASDLRLVVPEEVALRQFPGTKLGHAEGKPKGSYLLHSLHDDLKYGIIPDFSQILLRLR